MKIKKIKLLEERLADLEEGYKTQSNTFRDLMEYLGYVDDNFKLDQADYSSWQSRLKEFRQAELIEKEIFKARQILGHHGYIVVEHESEIDAARVKKWVSSKNPIDDDIPF